jgi:hypothetical protein
MSKGLILLSSFEEYHYFIKFNAFINSIKKLNIYEEIIAVVPEVAIYIISETNKIISISNDYLNSKNANYPEILEEQNRNKSDFHKLALNYIKEKMDLSYYDVLQHSELYILDLINNKIVFEWYTANNLTTSYIRDWQYICNLMNENRFLYPTKKSYGKIKLKYNINHDKNTYLLLSRNFKNKRPCDNTDQQFSNIKEFIEYSINKNLQIINIGFPTFNLNIKHENYIEINDKLDHNDLMSLYYLTNGVLISGLCSAPCINFCTNIDLFIFTDEWKACNDQVSLIENRINICSGRVSTINVKNKSIESLYNILLNHKKVYTEIFTQEKEIIFLK